MTSPAESHAGARGRRRARRGEGELLRDEILDAAQALLVEHGTADAVTIRAVAERVGVSAPSIYLHFHDKDDLFYEACVRRFARLASTLQEAIAGSATVVERLRLLGHAYMAYGLSDPGEYLVLFGTETPSAVLAGKMENDPGIRAFQLLVDVLEEGVRNGELRPGLDPVATAVSVWGAVHGAVMLLITKGDLRPHMPIPPDEVVVETVLDLLLDAVTV
jgi:AcrR family transcriptional regulator